MIITINVIPLQPQGTIGTHQYPVFDPLGHPQDQPTYLALVARTTSCSRTTSCL